MFYTDRSTIILIVFSLSIIFGSLGGLLYAGISGPDYHKSDEICFVHIDNISCIEKCSFYKLWWEIKDNYCYFKRVDK